MPHLAQTKAIPNGSELLVAFDTELESAAQRGYVAAYRWLGHRDEARDAVHEAIARALAARRQYDPARPFYPWFYRILKNFCFDRLRRRPHEPSLDAQVVDRAPERRAGAEVTLLKSERERAVWRAIARLSDDQREVIELRHFQDLTYEQMAEVLGCPQGTVMSRLFRARRNLRALLLDNDDWADAQRGGLA